jgi:hypothetical protein
MRRAPEGGYDFREKELYRQEVWQGMQRAARDWSHGVERIDLENATVLILPSLEGLEIDRALERGVQPDRLYIVDDDPKVIATLKVKYPDFAERMYTMPIDKAAEMLAAQSVKIDVINLDLCHNISKELQKTVTRVIKALHPHLIGVTVQRGRETTAIMNRVRVLGENFIPNSHSRSFLPPANDRGRMLVIEHFLTEYWAPILHDSGRALVIGKTWATNEPKLWRAGIYNSPSGVSMLWTVWRLKFNRDELMRSGIFYNEVLPDIITSPRKWILTPVKYRQEYTNKVYSLMNGIQIVKTSRHVPGQYVKAARKRRVETFNPELSIRDWLWTLEDYHNLAAKKARQAERAAKKLLEYKTTDIRRKRCINCNQYFWPARQNGIRMLPLHRHAFLVCPGSNTTV